MSKKIIILSVCLLAFGLNQNGASKAHAQSDTKSSSAYTKSKLNSIRYQNSTSRFSSQRFQNKAFSSAVPRLNNRSVTQNLFSSRTNRPKRKPFSSISRGSSVTPYLGLGGLQTGGAPNYYTNVKPRLDQQRQNTQNQRRNLAVQRQLNQVAAQAPYNPKGSETLAPTGHAAVYLNLGGYYPETR